MVVKVYISGISGNHEIRKQQQRVLFILSSLKIDFEVIDITEIGKEEERDFMRNQCKLHDKANPLPPQIFNDETYCGDYDDFEAANEDDQLMPFLKLGSSVSVGDSTDLSNQSFQSFGTKKMLSNVETGESEAVEA